MPKEDKALLYCNKCWKVLPNDQVSSSDGQSKGFATKCSHVLCVRFQVSFESAADDDATNSQSVLKSALQWERVQWPNACHRDIDHSSTISTTAQ
jgi:hypothetical protein